MRRFFTGRVATGGLFHVREAGPLGRCGDRDAPQRIVPVSATIPRSAAATGFDRSSDPALEWK